MGKKEQYPLKHVIWLLVIGSVVVLGLALLIGCDSDGGGFVVSPDPVPKKCLVDPCPGGELLRECEVHGYVCSLPEPCSPRDVLLCQCEDEAENGPMCERVPEI
jgi:hypothetical protein